MSTTFPVNNAIRFALTCRFSPRRPARKVSALCGGTAPPWYPHWSACSRGSRRAAAVPTQRQWQCRQSWPTTGGAIRCASPDRILHSVWDVWVSGALVVLCIVCVCYFGMDGGWTRWKWERWVSREHTYGNTRQYDCKLSRTVGNSRILFGMRLCFVVIKFLVCLGVWRSMLKMIELSDEHASGKWRRKSWPVHTIRINLLCSLWEVFCINYIERKPYKEQIYVYILNQLKPTTIAHIVRTIYIYKHISHSAVVMDMKWIPMTICSEFRGCFFVCECVCFTVTFVMWFLCLFYHILLEQSILYRMYT